MGVLGLTPFIQRYCPEVIRELPHRLKTLSGKTIAIDGTLITQRLHFAAMPCENRHILGWYRLIRELKESEVGVICVFDGEGRGLAKQRENERRRNARRMEVARGGMETDRLRRLRRLTDLLKQYQALPERQRDRSVKTLRKIINKPREPSVMTQDHTHAATRGPDSDIFRLANEPLAPDLMPLHTSKEDPLSFALADVAQSSRHQAVHDLLEAAASQVKAPSPSEPTQVAQAIESQHKSRGKESLRIVPMASDEPLLTEEYITSKPLEERPVVDSNLHPPLVKIKPQRSPLLPSSSTNLPLEVNESAESTHHAADAVVRPPKLPVENFVESPPFVTASGETTQEPRDSTDQPHETTVYAPCISEPGIEDITEVEDEALLKFSEFFDPPTTVYLDTGLVGAAQPHAIEPPENMCSDREENITSHEFDVSDFDGNVVNQQVVNTPHQTDNIAQEFISLFEDYQQSVPAIMSPPLPESPVSGTSEEADARIREEYVMSKNQVQLTVDEGSLWNSFVDPSALDESGAEKLESLAQKSETLWKSYEKRNNPPTAKTYEESKLILQAMGVPCIETVAPYEAEALAASLVHHGFADYVASEDTDVLVYEAPLLRNITNRQMPLTLLSGAEFRQVLRLDRASYVDFALLLGTDFSQRIKNLGPHRAIKLIRTHGRIEHVIANEPKFIPRLPQDAYMEQVEIARLVFETLPPVPDPKLLQPSERDEELVAAILEKYGVHRAAMVDWDFGSALDGNYFNDNPAMT